MASSPEPAPGLGVFVVVNGEEEQCRPDGIRRFFHDRVGPSRIVTSSRSYSNEKTFVTLEFPSNNLARQAVDRFHNCRINNCHTNVTFFKSRNGGGGRGQFHNFRGSRGNQHFQGSQRGFGGSPGQWGSRGMPQRRGRSFGDLQGERMRGMSPSSAARFIEQRLQDKERRQGGYKGEGGNSSLHGSHDRSYSRSRSRSPSGDRDYGRRSSSREYHSSARDYRSRSPSVSRDHYSRSPSPNNESWQSRSRSRSPLQRSPSEHGGDDFPASDEDNGHYESQHRHHDSDSESGVRRRMNRKRHMDKSEIAGGTRDADFTTAVCVDKTTADQAQELSAEEMVLGLLLPDGNLPATTFKLVDAKREGLEQEFGADVSTIVSVTDLLIGQDKSLEGGIRAAVRGCVNDIRHRYLEEFDVFVKTNVPA